MQQLEVPFLMWQRLINQLRKRGKGIRESGAFLLAKPGSNKICRFICYDELDERALETGIITFHACGFVRLWDICESQGLRVVADVHTHPGSWTDQSEADRTHPMIAQAGHVALILPHFAQGTKWSFRGAGIFEYCGNHKWNSHSNANRLIRLKLL